MMHPWHVHGNVMRIVARDGRPLGSAAFECDTLGVNPGERYDALITPQHAGLWAFHCHILPHVEAASGMFGMVNTLTVVPTRGGRGRDRQGARQLTGPRHGLDRTRNAAMTERKRTHTRRRGRRSLAVGLMLIALAGCAAATSASAGLAVSGAWVRAVATTDQATAGYLTIANPSSAADALLSASSPGAATVGIHKSEMDSTGLE